MVVMEFTMVEGVLKILTNLISKNLISLIMVWDKNCKENEEIF